MGSIKIQAEWNAFYSLTEIITLKRYFSFLVSSRLFGIVIITDYVMNELLN